MEDLFIPKKCKVGFDERKDTYTKKLGFIIPYREKGYTQQESLDKVDFKPVTDCSVLSINIHTLSGKNALLIIKQLRDIKALQEEFGISEDSRYSIDQYITDIVNKVKADKYKKDLKELKEMENKLSDLLSAEKKTEILIEEIENKINVR